MGDDVGAPSADEARFARLRELGITEYGARTYIALLRMGVSEARAVSDMARVPQSKIYAVLDDLADEGLVHVHPEHPKKYSAADLSTFVDERQRAFEAKARTIAERRSEILDLFRPPDAPSPVAGGGAAAQLRGRAQITRKLSDLLDDTQERWLVMGVPTTPDVYEPIRANVEGAAARGVKLCFLLPIVARTVESAAWLAPLAELRVRERDSEEGDRVTVVVSDARRAMLIHWASLSGEESARDTALLTTDPAMASVIQYLVESHWRSAGPFETTPTRARGGASGSSVRR